MRHATHATLFPSGVIDAAGPRNDLVDCLACRIDEQLRTAAGMVFANKPARDGCQEALGRKGMAVLRFLTGT